MQIYCNAINSFFFIAVVFTPSKSNESPAQPLKYLLTFHIRTNLLIRMVETFAIAFKSNFVALANYDKINSISSN